MTLFSTILLASVTKMLVFKSQYIVYLLLHIWLKFVPSASQGVISFCTSQVVVPYSAATANFQFELSEPLTGDIASVQILCPIDIPPTSLNPLDITIDTASASLSADKRTVTIPYTITSLGDPVSVTCSVESIVGTQFQHATSERTILFVVNDIQPGMLPVIPNFSRVTGPLFKTHLILTSPVPADSPALTMRCEATFESDVSIALDKTLTPNCTFAEVAANTSTGVDVNSTNIWEIEEEIFEFIPGQVSKVVTVKRSLTSDIASLIHELILVTCCAVSLDNVDPGFVEKSTSMLASAYLTPTQSLNWSAAALPDSASERVLPNVAYVEVAPCPCDLIDGDCDVNCCCDLDCTSSENETFTSCIPGLPGGLAPANQTYLCTESPFDKADWFPFLCVMSESNAHLGLFYTTEPGLRTNNGFNERLAAEDVSYTFSESEKRDTPEPFTIVGGYGQGESIKTGVPNIEGAVRDPNSMIGVLSLPQISLTGQCMQASPVRYLVDIQTDCSYSVTETLCSRDSILSAAAYAQPTGIINPSCPRQYTVLKDGVEVITEVDVKYYCVGPDTQGYTKSIGQFSDLVSPFTTSLFDYELPTGNCTDLFGNDICDTPSTPVVPSVRPRCAWDDGLTSPLLPSFTAGVCQNSVLDVKYEFSWSGTKVLVLTAEIVLGDVPIVTTQTVNKTIVYQDNGTTVEDIVETTITYATVLTQFFDVKFTHNYTSQAEAPFTRSGNPGYDMGKPLISALADGNGAVNTSAEYQMNLFKTGADGLCFGAGRQPVMFGEDTVSGCALRLGLPELVNCTDLKKLVLNRLHSWMPSDHIGRFGDNPTNNMGYWVAIARPDLTSQMREINETDIADQEAYYRDYINATNTDPNIKITNDSDLYFGNNIEAVCSGVVSGIHLEILYAETGRVKGVTINEVIGARINYTVSSWSMTCMGSRSSQCYGTTLSTNTDNGTDSNNTESSTDRNTDRDMVESFYLSSSVRFIKVPGNIKPPVIRFWQDYDPAVCKYETCWRELFYPLTTSYDADDPQYTLGFSLVILAFLLFFFAITMPWW